MFNHIARLALATAVLMLLGANAGAQNQNIQQLCAKSKDKVQCNCWLGNGARVVQTPDGRVRFVVDHDGVDAMNKIAACMRRNGR